MTISLKSPLFKLVNFYEIQMSFPKSASKTLSHIQSTSKYIFLQAPYFKARLMNDECEVSNLLKRLCVGMLVK